jgi:hypothetical protein
MDIKRILNAKWNYMVFYPSSNLVTGKARYSAQSHKDRMAVFIGFDCRKKGGFSRSTTAYQAIMAGTAPVGIVDLNHS